MINVIQSLCHRRHTIHAMAYDPEYLSTEILIEEFKKVTDYMRDIEVIGPACLICKSQSWFLEVQATDFLTLDEAESELRKRAIQDWHK